MGKRLLQITPLLVLAGILLLQCSNKSTDPQPRHRQLTALEKQVARSGNEFGFKLFKEIVSQDTEAKHGNIFISPLSVSMALGMTYNGAREETKAAMEECLALKGMTVDEINESYQSLIDLLKQLDPRVKFDIANSIWYRQGFSFKQDFLDINHEYFDAEVAGLDFSDQEGSKKIINDWVSDKTNDKIPGIVDRINPSDVMFLINAIYFKGDWTTRFDEADTRELQFTRPDGSRVNVDGMHLDEAKMSFLANNDVIGLQMPYGTGDFAMTLLMPREGTDIDALIANLDESSWDNWLSGFRTDENNIVVPRFKLSYKLMLNDVLAALGMGVAFDENNADFSGISEDAQLFISRVMHKSFIQVDEKGTEAAAATSVGMGTTSTAPVSWIFSRPFIYVISATESNTILFMGKMAEPVWED